jgi:hypothetical protein
MTVNDGLQTERKWRIVDYFKTLPEGRITNLSWMRRRTLDRYSDRSIQQHYGDFSVSYDDPYVYSLFLDTNTAQMNHDSA